MFKKENIGVYVTLTLFGAGVGLLLGAYIASIFEERLEKEIEEPEEELVQKVLNIKPAVEAEVQRILNKEKDDEQEIVDGPTQTTRGKVVRAERPSSEDVDGSSGDGGAGETESDGTRGLDPGDRAELERLQQRYKVDSIAVEMLEKGLTTVEDLEAELVKSGSRIDYTGYSKPDLDDLVPVEDDEARFLFVGNDRGSELSREKGVTTRELVYDSNTDRLMRIVEGNRFVLVENPDGLIGDGTIDTVAELLVISGYPTVYVHDRQSNTLFRIIEYVE